MAISSCVSSVRHSTSTRSAGAPGLRRPHHQVRPLHEADAEGYITVAAPTTRTGLPGVFAAGDIVDHTYRQIIIGADTGAAAALDSERHRTARGAAQTKPVAPAVPARAAPAGGAARRPQAAPSSFSRQRSKASGRAGLARRGHRVSARSRREPDSRLTALAVHLHGQ
ncbi:hypothetical protein GCM10023324_19910 [Streptomyces youssoufiensis]